MTAKQAALDRCDREIAELAGRRDLDELPAFISTIAENDWKHERRLIEDE